MCGAVGKFCLHAPIVPYHMRYNSCMQLWRIKIPLHETWHFTIFCVGIVLGLAMSVLPFAAFFGAWQWIATGLLVFMFAWWKKWRWLVILALIGGMCVGISRGAIDGYARNSYSAAIGQSVTLVGRVSEDPDVGKQGEAVLRLTDIQIDDTESPAEVWVTLAHNAEIERSDVVTIEGKLQEGFGSFAASMYRAELIKVQRPQPGDVALHVRDSFGEKVRLGIHEPAASLGMGYLTGQRRSLPEELDAALKIAGLTHIVVASGYNLTILVRAVKRLFEKRSRYLTVFLSLLLIVGFMAVTGLSPSMMRAGLVAGLSLAAWYFGRKFHPVTLLSFAAALTGIINPSYVWGNLGWQLSFAAFAGVMVLAPLAQRYFFGDKKPGIVRQILGETISAQIMTAPLLLYVFGQISNVAIVANLLVLPLVPLAMLLTFVTGITGYILPMIVQFVALPAQWLLDYMVKVALTTAHVSWAQTELSISLIGVSICYAVIVAIILWMRRATGYRLRESNVIE